MSRKGNNEGSIRKRPDGKWEARYTVGRNDNGKQIQRSIYGKTRSEVSQKLTKVLNSINSNEYISPSKLTVAQWLKTWLKDYASPNLKLSTYISYEGYVNNHINPILGGIPIQELSCERLQHFFNEKHTNGRVDGQGGLSPKTLKNMYNMMHKAFEQACKNNLIPKNITQYIVLPKRTKKDIEILTVDEQKRLLKNIHSERLGFAILLTLSTGLRLGEVCALKWGDIDFERKTISVRRTLQRLCKTEDEKTASANKTIIVEGPVKTDNSHREVPIQNKIFDKLLEYQMQQQNEKEAAGCCYENNDYIFASPIGGVIEPSTMRDMYKRLLKKSNIRDTSFHALRHTFATRAIENNVPIKAVSDILGHSTVQITMDIYCHPSIDLKRNAVDKMADLW